MSNKIVYVVTGSDDGVLGVFGNIKAAYGVAKKYVEDSHDYNGSLKPYSWVCKQFKGYINCNVDVQDYNGTLGSAFIHNYYLNEEV